MSLQKIFFGPPGCGKSFRVRKVAIDDLKIAKIPDDLKKSQDMIETAFHPEYGYGDFVAKLMPLTKDRHIEYHIHAGPLIKALARSYAYPDREVLLVIDEINRGNCAQIFGDIFQLLDRDHEGWSEYGIDTSDLINDALNQELNRVISEPKYLDAKLEVTENKICKLRLPPNLNIIGTMNTSDESVYYMDTAFKRRWEFEFMAWDSTKTDSPNKLESAECKQTNATVQGTTHTWYEFLMELNAFIAAKSNKQNVDDKQVGVWFLKASDNRDALRQYQAELKKLSANACNDISKDAWKKCFPKAKDNTGTNLAKSIKPINYEPIKFHLKNTFNVELSSEFFEGIGVSQFSANLITHLDSISTPQVIISSDIKNKLLFFLWDNVFSRNRAPLAKLLGKNENELRTFGEFSSEDNVTAFIKGLMEWSDKEESQST